MMPEWTPEQKKAIDSRNGTILVSAAAGSGKTAVLVERVIRRLMDKEKPCTADKLLIVTFTRAATQQMRERIFKAISDELRKNPSDEHLKRQLMLLPFAKISTIDSFCNDIVRSNFHELEISPDYKLIEGVQLELLKNDAVNKTLDEFYAENSPEFCELINILVKGTDDSLLAGLIKTLHNHSKAFARPEMCIDSFALPYRNNEPLSESPWGRIILKYAADVMVKCGSLISNMAACLERDEIVNEKYGACVRDMASQVGELGQLAEKREWDSLREALYSLKFPSLGRLPRGYDSPEAEFIKKQKKNISEQLSKKLLPFFCVTENEHKDDMRYFKPIVEKLIGLVRRYDEILWEEKKKINSVDFSDITHLALKLLVSFDENGNAVKTDLAREFSERFDEILVDEFQDINELQSTLFSAVSKNDGNMFMVGDVKQSIYRFRQAMPEIFLKRREALEDYIDDNYPAKITLDRNFRSRAGVTENINFVFNQLMSEDAGGLEYDENESLVAAASYEECSFPQAELHIIGSFDDGTHITREIEAQHIAETINSIIKEGMAVSDKNGTRPASYKDFCILMRSTGSSKADLYAEVLARNNIPAYVSNKTGFFASSEVSTVINLMRVTDNPIQDIPLLTVMLSPIYGFTPDELAAMRVDERKKPIYHCVLNAAANGNKKCVDFIQKLDNLRMLASTLSCTEFLRELYDVTGFKAIASALKNGSQRNANLNMLLDYALKYEESGKRGLSGFVRFIDTVQRQKADLESASDISEAADVVKIMTIHKSKGLEFPVCILADLNTKFINDNRSSISAYHPDYGVCFVRRDSEKMCTYKTAGSYALNIAEKNSSVSEEMRVLYVAMTRAKERLICVTRYDNIESKLEEISLCIDDDKERINSFDVTEKTSMADWLVMAYLRHPDASKLRVMAGCDEMKTLPCSQRLFVNVINSVSEPDKIAEAEEKIKADEALLEEIRERLEYKYPYSELAYVPAKSSPSTLDAQDFSTRYFATRKPQFLSKSGLNPASRGTATHKFMEFFDYNAPFDVDEQADRMVSERHLTKAEAEALEREKLKKFFESDIAKRIKNSSKLLREKKVTVGIKAGELYPELPHNLYDELVVVQGYVDCAFVENGELIIVDYKTDRGVTMQELCERYRSQLKMYEYALSECTGIKVKGTLIYSFENAEYIAL